MNNKADSIQFTVNLEEKDVIDLMFYIARTRKNSIVLAIACLLAFLLLLFYLVEYSVAGIVNNMPLVIALVFCLIWVPVRYYIAGKSSFKRNQRLHETHHYEIDQNSIHIKGDSFESTFTWDKTAGVSENKNSFFIWQQKNIANIVPKRNLTVSDIDFLRQMANIYKRK